MNRQIDKLPAEKSMFKALICFVVGGLLLFGSLFSIVSIVTSPGYFSCLFTVALVILLTGMALWSGPRAYVHRMFEDKYKIRTYVLLGSIVGVLVSSLVFGSYLLSLLFCIIELNAVLLYFCNTFPIGRAANTSV